MSTPICMLRTAGHSLCSDALVLLRSRSASVPEKGRHDGNFPLRTRKIVPYRHVPMRPRPTPVFGLFLALLALGVQLAIGAVVPQPQVGLALDELGVICHAPAAPGETPSPPPHRMPDCVLCPLCAAMAAPPHVLASGAPVVPRPSHVTIIAPTGWLPPATAPPVAPLTTAQPRGPPIPA